MTAFLKIDRCAGCQREWPWEWVPQIELGGRVLAGTGVWRSGLVGGICDVCSDERVREAKRAAHRVRQQARLMVLLGGPRPEREFRLERFDGSGGNGPAHDRARGFDPERDNLYLFGGGGTGKTHLAYGIARLAFDRGCSVVVTSPTRLVRMLRMKSPEEEQRVLDLAISAEVLVVDGFMGTSESPFARQALQEILDGRAFADCGGLVITARRSPAQLLRVSPEDGVASRLAGMCGVVQLVGRDRRNDGPRA